MKNRWIEPTSSSYSQAVEVIDARRLLFVSGQIPTDEQGNVPTTFADQARLVWSNIYARLSDAGMNWDNLVKVTVFLADRQFRDENTAIRMEILADRNPAITVLIADIFDKEWLLEIEVIAAA